MDSDSENDFLNIHVSDMEERDSDESDEFSHFIDDQELSLRKKEEDLFPSLFETQNEFNCDFKVQNIINDNE